MVSTILERREVQMSFLNSNGNLPNTSHPFIQYKSHRIQVSHADALKVVSCTVLLNLYAELMENCPNGHC